jgi:hypothetical protein
MTTRSDRTVDGWEDGLVGVMVGAAPLVEAEVNLGFRLAKILVDLEFQLNEEREDIAAKALPQRGKMWYLDGGVIWFLPDSAASRGL